MRHAGEAGLNDPERGAETIGDHLHLEAGVECGLRVALDVTAPEAFGALEDTDAWRDPTRLLSRAVSELSHFTAEIGRAPEPDERKAGHLDTRPAEAMASRAAPSTEHDSRQASAICVENAFAKGARLPILQ